MRACQLVRAPLCTQPTEDHDLITADGLGSTGTAASRISRRSKPPGRHGVAGAQLGLDPWSQLHRVNGTRSNRGPSYCMQGSGLSEHL